MPVVHLHHPSAAAPVARTLAVGDALLVGRAPDAGALAATLPGWRIEALALDDEAVSAQHCLLWCDAQGLWLQDLASRNGTFARATALPTQLPGAAARVDLAGLHTAGAPALASAPVARWTGRDDFAERVRDAVATWLADEGVEASVTHRPRSPSPDAATFALATGGVLDVAQHGTGTLDLRMPALLQRVADFVAAQNALVDQELGHGDDFILRSPALREAHRRVWEAARSGRRLLLLGPSGTGKERLARCHHLHSDRRDGPFVALNCANLTPELLATQLFGARRGSFTGATHDVRGALEAAHGGTLFLDEVAELDPTTQASLLRFLDERGEYTRLGDTEARRADVRVVCATNRRLRESVGNTFREDLWYRFAGAVVDVPPLRDRPEDVEAFLRARPVGAHASDAHAPGARSAWDALAPEARELLLRHSWPGNFRELDNLVGRLPPAAPPHAVDAATTARCLREGAATPAPAAPSPTASPSPAPSPAPATPWEAQLHEAVALWRAQHASDPDGLGAMKEFVEHYLKPVFTAHASGVARGAPADGLNWSAIARRLDAADGSTIRRQVERYLAHQNARPPR